MNKQKLYSTLISSYVNKNVCISFSNDGIEASFYYDGTNNMDLLNEVDLFVKNLGFKTELKGKKYKKLLILC